MLINKNLQVYILKWLYERKDNILITKSMLPKLDDFKSFSDTDVWQSLDLLNDKNLITLKKMGNVERPTEFITISEQGEHLLQLNHMI